MGVHIVMEAGIDPRIRVDIGVGIEIKVSVDMQVGIDRVDVKVQGVGAEHPDYHHHPIQDDHSQQNCERQVIPGDGFV
jgi:hypothetical protein